MHPPVLLLISTDPHAGPLLEQAIDHRRATIILVETTEEGLRILKDQADLALVVCDESQGRISSQVSCLRPSTPLTTPRDHPRNRRISKSCGRGVTPWRH